MLRVLLVVGLLTGARLIGGGIAFDANPVIMMAAPPAAQRLYITHVSCSHTDGIDNPSNTVTFNDTKSTTITIPADSGDVPQMGGWNPTANQPTLQFAPGQAATFKVSAPSVVRCMAWGYASQ